MIIWDDEAIILSSVKFSENSLVLKVFSKNRGIQKGLVRGAKSKKKGNIYDNGNLVKVSYKSRTDEMLGTFVVEIIKPSYIVYLSNNLNFSAIISILNLLEFCMLENEPEKDLYINSKNLIYKIILSEYNWLDEYVRWELFLLKQIGFGLQLSKCVISNKTNNLKYVSPKSGCAVNLDAGSPWKNKLLTLPSFLISKQKANEEDIIAGLELTSHFLKKFSNSINKTLPFTRNNFIDIILNK